MRIGDTHIQESIEMIREKKKGKCLSDDWSNNIFNGKKGSIYNKSGVLCFDYDLNLIIECKGVSEATFLMDCSPSLITLCCENKCITAKGYIRVYVDDAFSAVYKANRVNRFSTSEKKVA